MPAYCQDEAPRAPIDTTPISQSMVVAIGLIALFVVGQGSALALIDAPPYASYQHFRPWRQIVTGRPWALWGLVLQASVVGGAAVRWRAPLRRLLARVSPWRAAVLFLLMACSLAVPTQSVGRATGELVLAGTIASVALVNLVLVGLALPRRLLLRAEAWADARITLDPDSSQVRRWDRGLPLVVALWVTAVAAVISLQVFEALPHIDDSISNYFQAKYFAAGRLFADAPPDPRSFQVDQTVVDSGKWYGYAFPGWPAVLALGVAAGVPWLANPVLGGLLVLVGHAFVRRRCGRGTANAAALLLAFSPWLLFTSAEFMVHPLTGVLALTAGWAFDHASERQPRWPLWAVLAGGAVGALALTRAIDGLLVAAAIGLTLVVDRRFLRSVPAAGLAGLVACAIGALIFPYNRAVTGRASYAAHMAWSDGRWGPGVDRMGFGADIGIRAWPNLDPLPGHGFADVVLNTNKNLFMANADLFGWAMGSLVFIGLGLAIGCWRRDDAAMLLMPLAFAIGYNFYWFSGGPDFGPRYWYPALVPLVALTVRGAQMTARQWRADGTAASAGRAAAVLAVATLSAATTIIPWRGATKYHGYRGVTGEVRELARSRGFDRDDALVFVRSDTRDYQSAFALNPATLDGSGTIYALDVGPDHRARVVARFSNRPVWVIGRRPPGATTAGRLDVIAGPLAPGTVPQ